VRPWCAPVGACLLLATQTSADELGVEAGFGLVDSGVVHSSGAFWRKAVTTRNRRSLLVGPRLGGLLHLGGAAYPWYVDLDLAGALVLEDPRARSRLVWGLGPSWNAGRHIRSFEIEQDARPAFGLHGYLGYGLSFTGVRGSLLLETRIDIRSGFTHERKMTNSRTNMTATVEEKSGSVGIVIYAGYALGTWLR
jgi:hypothetical protein